MNQGKEKSGSAQGAGANAPKSRKMSPVFSNAFPYAPCRPGKRLVVEAPDAGTPNYQERD